MRDDSRLTIPEVAPTEAGQFKCCAAMFGSASRFLKSRRLKPAYSVNTESLTHRLTIPEVAPTEAPARGKRY